MDDESGCAQENRRRRQGALGEVPRRGQTGQKETHHERRRARKNRRRRQGALGESSRRQEQVIHRGKGRAGMQLQSLQGQYYFIDVLRRS